MPLCHEYNFMIIMHQWKGLSLNRPHRGWICIIKTVFHFRSLARLYVRPLLNFKPGYIYDVTSLCCCTKTCRLAGILACCQLNEHCLLYTRYKWETPSGNPIKITSHYSSSSSESLEQGGVVLIQMHAIISQSRDDEYRRPARFCYSCIYYS